MTATLPCPSPYADAVAGMFISGASLPSTAGFFRISTAEAARLIAWVCQVNRDRQS